MNTPIDPCANLSLSVKLPKFECTDSVLPNFNNLDEFGRGLGSLPGQLGRIAICTVEARAKQIADAIDKLLKLFDKTFGSSLGSVNNPVLDKQKVPEFEMGTRMKALFQEFKLFLELRVLNVLSKIIPNLSFLNIPLPFLPGRTVKDLLSEEGRQKIRDDIGKRADQIADALGAPWNITFDGSLTIKNDEMKKQTIISRVWSEFHKNLLSLISRGFKALVKLTEPIRKIWQALRLPDIPNLVSLNFEEIFDSVWKSVKDMAISAKEKMQKMIDFFMEFDLKQWIDKTFGPLLKFIAWPFKTKVKDILKVTDPNKEANFKSTESRFQKWMTAVKELFEQIPTLILELWMQVVLKFFKAILKLVPLIGELLKYIPFTFCTFIGLVASPILGLGSAVSSLIPPGIKVEPA